MSDPVPPLQLRCWSCPRTFVTHNELSTHHLDAHERPLPASAGARDVTPRRTRFRPPNWKARSLAEWHGNGVQP
jgi:hypothetical protein